MRIALKYGFLLPNIGPPYGQPILLHLETQTRISYGRHSTLATYKGKEQQNGQPLLDIRYSKTSWSEGRYELGKIISIGGLFKRQHVEITGYTNSTLTLERRLGFFERLGSSERPKKRPLTTYVGAL